MRWFVCYGFVSPFGELLFGIAQKVTKKASPNRAVSCGARNGRDPHKSPDGALTARGGLMVRVYDRPLLRSSARGDGALKANSDRFAIGVRGPGCEHPG
jgi:hypothetical protein